MMRIAGLWLIASLGAWAPNLQESTTPPSPDLERLRSLTPRQVAELRRRLQLFKQLPREEQQRLRENLQKLKSMAPDQVRKAQERAQRLSDQEKKEYADLASGFFRWAQRHGILEGFPRGYFFSWLKKDRPQEIDRIRKMDPGPGRLEAFSQLANEFRQMVERRLLDHVRRHRCAGPDFPETLPALPPREFWKRYQEIQQSCFAAPARPAEKSFRK